MGNVTASKDTLSGKTIGHYLIGETIGAGGMGVVYCAKDTHLDRQVAIKVLHPGTVTDEHSRKLFRREALALSKLNHPSIATIYDFDTQEGIDFLVMEYVAGPPLKMAKNRHGRASDRKPMRAAHLHDQSARVQGLYKVGGEC